MDSSLQLAHCVEKGENTTRVVHLERTPSMGAASALLGIMSKPNSPNTTKEASENDISLFDPKPISLPPNKKKIRLNREEPESLPPKPFPPPKPVEKKSKIVLVERKKKKKKKN